MPREDLPIINANNAFHMKAAHALLDTYKGRGNIRIEITVCRNQRTLDQNSYYYGVVVPVIAKAFAENEGDAQPDVVTTHARLKKRFLERPKVRRDTGEVVDVYIPSSAELDVAEFSAYLDKCIAFARDELMVNVPPPDDYRNEQPVPKRKTA